MTFESDKKNVLTKLIKHDKSKKGSLDKEIEELVNEINSKNDFYTTSSCAGRILLIKKGKSGKKNESEWFIASHKKVALKELKDAIKKASAFEEESWLKHESLILHIACRTTENAENLLNLIRSKCGMKRAGIISMNRNILEIIGTDSIYTLIAKDKKVLVDDNYVKEILKICNTRMELNKKRIDLILKEIKKL